MFRTINITWGEHEFKAEYESDEQMFAAMKALGFLSRNSDSMASLFKTLTKAFIHEMETTR